MDHNFLQLATMLDKGKFKRSELIPIDEAECHVFYNSVDVYSTYVNFGQDAIDYCNSNGGYIRGYDGIVDSSFYPIDIDSEDAVKVAREITNTLVHVYEVDKRSIMIFYSGCKGLHLYISASQFAISPTLQSELVKRFKWIAKELHPKIDINLYKKNMLLRIENTFHSGGKRYKIPLTYKELHSLTIEQIRELAKYPRLLDYPYFHECTSNDTLEAMWTMSKEKVGNAPIYHENTLSTVLDIHNGVIESQRNHTAFRIVMELRRSGKSVPDIYGYMFSWNMKNKPPMDMAELTRTIESALNRECLVSKQDMKEHLRLDWLYNSISHEQQSMYIHMLVHLHDREKQFKDTDLVIQTNQWIKGTKQFALEVGVGDQKIKDFKKLMVESQRVKLEVVYPDGKVYPSNARSLWTFLL